jgi:methyl-accepting chemotaxis protein
MTRQWTFGQKIIAGFAVTVVLTITMGALGVYALRSAVANKDRVIDVEARLLIDAEKLRVASAEKANAVRGFLLTLDEQLVTRAREARAELTTLIGQLRDNLSTEEDRSLLAAVERIEGEHQQASARAIELRRTDASLDEVARTFDRLVLPKREELDATIQAFTTRKEQALREAVHASSAAASTAISKLLIMTVAVVILAAAISFLLPRTLGRQIGTAVGQVQSSSAELQAAANQQATGARQQATAMNEISTTISELLATSRQIAESAQRVARIAEQTTTSARDGEQIMRDASESVAAIPRQVDQIVNHMLELGKKSQQIGGVLDIVSELAEQTNILAINATIEAAGAGESGRRFGVVADEIRNLADRVAGSTKQIRVLIEDVRTAVNTTVMATETGSKTVHAGMRQFGDVTSAFRQIGSLIATTTEAAKEIELSTKQQTSAVEQVTLAIGNVAQATRESEASSGQTLQTASQLALLSHDLLRLVRPQAAA